MRDHDEHDDRLIQDDDRITAYALDELDQVERTAFERSLEANPALLDEVGAIRRTVARLQREMDTEPGLGLTPEQRALIESRLGGDTAPSALIEDKTVLGSRSGMWWVVGTTALAACLGLIFILPLFMQNEPEGSSFASREAAEGPQAPGANVGTMNKLAETEEAERRDRQFGGERDLLLDAATTEQREAGAAGEEAPDASTADLEQTGYKTPMRTLTADASSTQSAPAGPAGGQRGGGGGSLEGGGGFSGGAPVPPTEESLSGQQRRTRFNGIQSGQASSSSPPGGGGGALQPETERAPKDSPGFDHRGESELLDDLVVANGAFGDEAYDEIVENPFRSPTEEGARESTFAVDVDTASYANVRRFLNEGRLPPPNAVRIEEMINYFDYAYEAPLPEDVHPFSTHIEVGACPWTPDHRLVRIGLKGLEIDPDNRVGTNLVFLIDVSGSMRDHNKLPLLRESLHLLVDELTEDDRIALVVYAGDARVLLESTYCNQKDVIHQVVDTLRAGGSTNGGAGIEMAYEIAQRGYIEGGVNRVILATDGDLNVGVSDDDELVKVIEEKRETGVFLSVLGFGTGNIKDAKLEKISNAGNGNYAYIDSLREAQRVLVERIAGTLITIAKDVKIQVEFNPRLVRSYRLIGYENRTMPNRDFRDDQKDAGEIGSGHMVTALYEVDPLPADEAGEPLDEQPDGLEGHMLRCSLRYKQPDGETATELTTLVADSGAPLSEATADFRFATSVAAFGMMLRGSEHAGIASYPAILNWAEDALGEDPDGRRAEFLTLVQKARDMTTERDE